MIGRERGQIEILNVKYHQITITSSSNFKFVNMLRYFKDQREVGVCSDKGLHFLKVFKKEKKFRIVPTKEQYFIGEKVIGVERLKEDNYGVIFKTIFGIFVVNRKRKQILYQLIFISAKTVNASYFHYQRNANDYFILKDG